MVNTNTNWNSVKESIITEYPFIDNESTEFFQLAVTKYKDLTKCASNEDLIDRLYQEGIVSKNAINIYKEAKFTDSLKNSEPLKAFGLGALTALGSGAAIGGMGALKNGVSNVYNHLKRKKRLEDVYKFYPTLRNADHSMIQAGMKDIERLNPEVVKSPLITGSTLRNIVTSQDFNPEQAKTLTEIKGYSESPIRKALEGFNDSVKDNMELFDKPKGPSTVIYNRSGRNFVKRKKQAQPKQAPITKGAENKPTQVVKASDLFNVND